MPETRYRGTQVPEDRMNLAGTLDILYGVSCVGAFCFYPVTRRKMGVRPMGWFGFFAFCLMVALAQAWHSAVMSAYVWIWLIMGLISRFTRDKTAHSRSCGYPVFYRLVRNYNVAAALEALAVALGGAATAQALGDETAALFFFFGGLGMALKESIEATTRREELTRMRDAQIEARNRAEAYREW